MKDKRATAEIFWSVMVMLSAASWFAFLTWLVEHPF